MSGPFTTPTRPTRFITYEPSPSPLTEKRRRRNRAQVFATSSSPARFASAVPPTLPHSPYRFNSRNEVEDNPPVVSVASASTASDTTPTTPPTAMQRSLQAMEEHSQVIRQKLTAEEQDDKETADTYARQVTNYQVYWNTYQAALVRDDPMLVPIPAFPIIATKVTIYLEHETTRPQKRKRSDGSDSTATIGVHSVKQIVSALENSRLNNQHLYPNIPEAQMALRLDLRIKRFESAAAHKEPQRVKMAHTLKATGTNADTFTPDDLKRCAGWCLTDFKGPMNIYIGLRDRAMLLTSCSVAFHGDNTRSLLLSDLFATDVIFNAKGLGEVVPALALIADNAKHNQTGRTDEHGALRHRFVELCPIGSIALLLFSYFHVRNELVPNFVPDFSDSNYGDFGKREWYGIHLFPAGKSPMDEMGYDNHRKRVNLIYKQGVTES
ncbi:hypothetical protein DFH07DRAFT_977314 [Mycena maculata]|uniref:Ndc10 domain-containing protein n=1 Tax=Mycena maculata TaxID=230809 RepID=A0AAD7INK2_9AGAR|nr:hypothetical protein DFH07DRAFT_977314 [Mycena maculata]